MDPDELFPLYQFLINASAEGAHLLLSAAHAGSFEEVCHTIALICRFLVVHSTSHLDRLLSEISRLWQSDLPHHRITLMIIANMCSVFRCPLRCLSVLEHSTHRRHFAKSLATLLEIVSSVLVPSEDSALLEAALRALERILEFPDTSDHAQQVYTITYPPALAGVFADGRTISFLLDAATDRSLSSLSLSCLSHLLFADYRVFGGSREEFLSVVPDASVSLILFRLSAQHPALDGGL
jgi:hypothetical protein